jgi:hypothetical protein
MDKDAGVNVFEVYHGVNNLVFAIHPDGSLFQSHLTETNESNIHDNEGHSSVHGGSSVFVGNMRISYVNGLPRFEYIDSIPAVLAAAPYNIVAGQLSKAASLYTVRDWLVLARNTASDYKIRARDVFTDASDWSPLGVDFAKSLTEDPQAFIDQASTDIAQNQTDITTLQNASGGSSLEIENTSGSATLSITANTDVAAATTSITLRAESSSNTEDREYVLGTDVSNNDDLVITCETAANGLREGFRFNPSGHVAFSGSSANPLTNLNAAQFQVKGSAYFRDTLKVLNGSTFLDNISVGTAASPKTITLNGSLLGGGPTSILHSGSSSASASGNTVDLIAARDIRIVCGGLGGDSGTQSHRFKLPTNPVLGDRIVCVNRANAVYLSISNSASDQFISDGSTRTSATNKSVLIQKYSTPPDFFTTITCCESLAADNVTIEKTWVTSHGIVY